MRGAATDSAGTQSAAAALFPKIARIAYVLVFAALAIAAALNFPPMRADLAGLLGEPKNEAESALVALSRASANRVRVLIEAENFERASAGALAFEAAIPAGTFAEPSARAPSEILREFVALYAEHSAGLLGVRDREALAEGAFSDVEQRALSLWLAPAGAPVPAPRDPFGLLAGFLSELPLSQGGFSLRDGWLCAEFDGKTFILLEYSLAPGTAPAALASKLDFVKKFTEAASAGTPEFRVRVSGAPFHTASAAQQSVREVNALLAFGFAVLFVLLVALFRSLRILVPAALSIGAGFLAGFAATALVFPQIHVLVFVFGTSLVGLGADYAFHFYLKRGADIRRALFTAFLTTILSFSVLLFSSFSVLRQLAVFSIVGLAFVLGFVLLFAEKFSGTPQLPQAVGRAENFARALTQKCRAFLLKGGLAALLIAAAVGIAFFAKFGDDVRSLYAPPDELAARDSEFSQILARAAAFGVPAENAGKNSAETGASGTASAGAAFCVVPGASLEEILQKEEAAGFAGTRLSAFLPSQKRQAENAALAARLHANSALAETLGFAQPFALPQTPPLTAADVPAALRKFFFALYFPNGNSAAGTENAGGGFSLVPVPANFRAPEGTFVLTPSGAISALLESYRAQTIRLLAAAFAVLLVALAVLYGRKTPAFLVAPALTIASVVAVLSFCGIGLSFVHFLSFFLLIGFGLDYCVFRDAGGGERELPVLLSCFTSALSFGLLAFTSFAMTRAFGLALGLGLVFAYFYSTLLSRKNSAGSSGGNGGAWFEQKEQSAGRIRLEILWLIYRFCPLRLFKIVLFCVSAGIFAFAFPMRRASRQFRRVLNAARERRALPPARFSSFAHMRAFVEALFDKFDAAALRRQDLKIVPADASEFEKFDGEVRAGTGAFLLCSHVGNIEILQNLPRLRPDLPLRRLHAFKEMSHDGIFLDFLRRHCRFDEKSTEFHDTRGIDLSTASEMKNALGRGELVLMAADRVSAGAPTKNLAARMLDCDVAFPRGVFAFARLMECPIFFVACVKTAPGEYTFFCEKAPEDAPDAPARKSGVPAAYARFCERLILRFPTQFFQFYDCFGA